MAPLLFVLSPTFWAFDFLHESHTTLRKYLVEIVGKVTKMLAADITIFPNVMNTIAVIESNDTRLD